MRAPIRGRAIRTLAATALLLSACTGEPVGTPAADSSAIMFPSADGVTLAGRLFGPENARAGIVLAHMYPSDQSAWFDFADRLADRGYRVLTFDFRGYCPGGTAGCSEGEKQIPAIWQDVEGAIQRIRSDGVTRVGLVGASMGGTASLIAASMEGSEVDAVVTLSAPISFEGLEVRPDELAQVSAAKLFIAGHADVTAAQAVETLYEQTIQPKRPEILTTDDHGTDILTGNQAGIASTEIMNWLDRYLPA